MNRIRVIPSLLIRDGRLVKTVKFSNERYIGDPINAVKIFNEKEVDELVLLDIDASKLGLEPSFDEISEIVSEAFMPIGYGGGISKIEHIERLFKIGIEKVILNTAVFNNASLIQQASNIFGSQSIVVSLDVKKDFWREYRIYTCSGTIKQKETLEFSLKKIQDLGAGELIINSIDNDGTMQGYDLELIKKVTGQLKIPVVALGGAGDINHFIEAVKVGASAVSAGSMFVFQGIHKAVLISYISSEQIESELNKIQ
ncbi:MAG: imidazole glycerol phosphate synthase subunit HisF [Bacteroidetes bacterium GWE2_39_28]|nr:MAG: imidazole glycerol phosphate synthase subunit HisF [Bacteroidetes bacterium GWE2_39_28]OFY13071.1 MAG: imidazole glycerol phosphate synthase subunit HisF [Bacteroidetes bacterium GWF2_39_10]OFZ09137.1 MAG: imidazole glycerol phosphate synthase subunit HisF [Bacteroidetes bacterium RIFOXYB2_FULL_39_7]OFZ12131.1 MAG: imidazole glycerol phosphate synthase subunit HisF [Bacteroidetes bacterium RIFOXYC2_FULL_39_11]HCT94562.1 imidazole glycerol phosphate synthase subunit HisF [Rikenellaceae b